LSDAKKSGGRDISELKQRLGLKKAAAAQSGQSGRQNGASGGVVAPPGLLPPPGIAQPQQPAIPNAADDPFGAMNAIAAVGTQQRAPEIVINLNDGKPVEQVGASNRVATILKIALPALFGLLVGAFIATNGKNAAFNNDGVAAAKYAYGAHEQPAPSTFLGLRKTLNDLDNLLQASGYKPATKTTKDLAAMAKRLEFVDSKIFEARMNALPSGVVAQLTQFYGGIAELKGMIDMHVKLAVNDDVVLSTGKKKQDDATVKDTENVFIAGKMRYGVIIQPGDSGDFGARLVEVGPPYCNGKQSLNTGGKCVDAELTGIGARNDSGGVFSSVDAVLTPQDTVAAKKLLVLLPSPVLDSLVAGSDSGASATFYVKRMKAIADRLGKLRQDAETLEPQLKPVADSGKSFSYIFW
jgi:hypothetical protein